MRTRKQHIAHVSTAEAVSAAKSGSWAATAVLLGFVPQMGVTLSAVARFEPSAVTLEGENLIRAALGAGTARHRACPRLPILRRRARPGRLPRRAGRGSCRPRTGGDGAPTRQAAQPAPLPPPVSLARSRYPRQTNWRGCWATHGAPCRTPAREPAANRTPGNRAGGLTSIAKLRRKHGPPEQPYPLTNNS